jgi:hypothetical protein
MIDLPLSSFMVRRWKTSGPRPAAVSRKIAPSGVSPEVVRSVLPSIPRTPRINSRRAVSSTRESPRATTAAGTCCRYTRAAFSSSGVYRSHTSAPLSACESATTARPNTKAEPARITASLRIDSRGEIASVHRDARLRKLAARKPATQPRRPVPPAPIGPSACAAQFLPRAVPFTSELFNSSEARRERWRSLMPSRAHSHAGSASTTQELFSPRNGPPLRETRRTSPATQC